MDAEALQVAVDVGCRRHHAAIATAPGRVLAEFDGEHTPAGFKEFFGRIEAKRDGQQPVCVAMEGYKGWARPRDQQVRARGYRGRRVGWSDDHRRCPTNSGLAQ